MRCEVIDIRGNSRERLGEFLIILYVLNILELILTKLLLWKVPDIFAEANIFLRLIIYGLEPYFLKIGLMAIVLIYWYWRSKNFNITQMKRSILAGKVLIGAYILINIFYLINLIIHVNRY